MSKIRKLSMTFFAIVASLLLAFSLVGVGNLAFAAQVGEDDAVSSVTDGENVTYHDSLKSAIEAAADGATVTLLRDATETVSVSKSLTLDLGKHTLSATTGSAVTVSTVSGGSEIAVEITNGAIVAKGDTDTDVIGVTAFAEEANSKCMVTLTDSLTVTASENCVYAYGKAIVNTSAMLTSDGLFPAIQTDETSGMRGGTTVNVVGGSVTHANGTAIYFPSEKGTLNISGGVVSGKVAVEVRGGTVNVSGGKLVASGEYKASETTAEGRIYESGVALGIAKMQDREVSASVSNGSISAEEGGKALQVDAEISSFVSGGTFSQSIDASYIAEGSVVTDEDGTTTVVVGEQSDYVARIGTTGYDSLQSAVSAAQSGETVVVLKDTELTSSILFTQNITLDLNGKTITSAEIVFKLSDAHGVEVTIQNGTIDATASVIYAQNVVENCKVTFEKVNMTVNTNSYDAIWFSYNTGAGNVIEFVGSSLQTKARAYGINVKDTEIVLTDSEVHSETHAIALFSGARLSVNGTSSVVSDNANAIANNGSERNSDTEIIINGGTISGVVGIYHPGAGTLTIKGGTISGKGSAVEMRNGTLIVTGGALTASSEFATKAEGSGSSVSGAVIAISPYKNREISVTVSGGEIQYVGNDVNGKAFYEAFIPVEANETAPVPTISISGGKFAGGVVSTRADNYISGGNFTVAPGYSEFVDGYSVKVGEDGVLEVVQQSFVAVVDNVGYHSLQEAIGAAGSDATVTLLKDTSETVNIAEGKDIVLDLNGKTLTSDKASTATVSNDGTVRITSSVEGGKITRGTTKYYVILNHGTMTIDGAITVENTNGSDTSSLIDNGWYNPADRPEGKYAVLTIDGGEFVTATPIAIKNDEFGRLTVNGGTFRATNQSVQNWGYAELHGGHFTSQVIGWSYDNMPDDKIGTVIDGGKFDSGVGAIYSGATGDVMGYLVPDKASPLDISGGSFKAAIHYSYFADGHVADVTKVDEEGYVTVEANETGYVAAVGGVGYVSLQTAINAAGSGATVTLLKDTSETVNIAEGKDIVLDLNGKTLTSDKASTATVSNDGTVRITSSVEGGKITRGTTKYYVILNHGTMTIDGAITVENTNGSDTSSLIDNGWYNPADRPEGKYAVLTIDGGEFVTATPIAIKNDEFGRLTVNGGTFTATNQSVQNWAYAELHGGHFTSQVIGWSYDNMPDDGIGTVIDGGKYDSGVGTIYSGATGNVMGYLVPDKASPLDISGGSFKSAVHYSYFAEGFVADVTKVDEEGYATVVDGEYVALNNGIGYVSLQSAIDAVPTGETITLLCDVTESVVIPEGKEVTIDLNEKTITNIDGQHTITNNGTLTIEGVGTVDNVSHGKAALYNNGVAVLNGGVYSRSLEAGTATGANGNSWYTIFNDGDLTVNAGVEVCQRKESTNNFSSLVENGYNKPATLTINGGTFTAGLNAVKNESGTVTIKDGTFLGGGDDAEQKSVLNWDTLEISGGTFKNVVQTWTWTDSTTGEGSHATTNISGGTFNGGVVAETYHGEEAPAPVVNITGGTFTGTVSGNKAEINVSAGKFSSAISATESKVTVSGSFDGEVSTDGNSTIKVEIDKMAMETVVYYIGAKENFVVATLEEVPEGAVLIAGRSEVSNFDGYTVDEDYIVLQEPDTGYWKIMDVQDFAAYAADYIAGYATKLAESGRYSAGGIYDLNVLAEMAASEMEKVDITADFDLVKQITELYTASMDAVTTRIDYEVALKEAKAQALADVRLYASLQGVALTDEITALVNGEAVVAISQVSEGKLAAYDAIDALAQEGATSLDEAKENAVAEIIAAANAEGETAVVVPTATLHAIYDARTVEEVEIYRTNALAEIADIRTYRQQIDDLVNDTTVTDAIAALQSALLGDGEQQGKLAEMQAAFEAKIAEVQTTLATLATSEEVAQLKSDLQSYIDDAVEEFTTAISGLFEHITAMETSLTTLGESVTAVSGKVDAANTALTELQQALETLQGTVDGLNNVSMEEIQAAIDGATQQFSQAMQDMSADIGELKTTLTTLGESVTAVSGKVDVSNQALTKLQNAITTLQGTVDGLNNVSMEEIQAAIDGATQQFSQAMQDMSADIGELKTTLTTLGESVTAVSGKVDVSNQALTTLQNAITTLQGTVDGLNNVSMEEIQTAITSATGELQSAISGIATDLDGLNQSLTTLSSDLATVGGNVTALNGTVATIQSAVTTLQSTVDGLNNVSLAEIQTAIDALETSVTQAIDAAETAVTEQLTAISGKVDTLTGALATTSSSLTTQIGEIKEAIAAIEATSPEAIAQLNATLADIGTKLTALDQKVTALTAVEESKTEGKQEIDNWLNSYVESMLASVSVGKQKSGLFTTATAAELSTTLKDKLVTLFGTENAQLVEKYYNDAMEAIDRAESVSDVNIAVSAFQTKVAMVEVVSGITSTTATQPTSDVEIFVLLAVAVVFGLVTVVLAMVVLSKRNK